MYGGLAKDTNLTVAQGAVYVLSLPAFNWQKQNITPEYGRWLHSCNVIGNRQMVSIGGLVTDISLQVTSDEPESLGYNSLPDPWPQGLGIFDLTAMEWKEEYNPAAALYVTPDAVKAYYQQNGRGPASWTNDVVQAWFTEPTSNHADSSSTPSTPQPGLPGSPGSSESDTSAIAGGTVCGVVGFALIALSAFFLLRRHRRRGRWIVTLSDTGYQRPEMDNNDNGRTAGADYHPCELQGTNDPIELPVRQVAAIELPV